MTDAPKRDESFEALLRFLRQTRGFDFTGYKRATLMRRMTRRMDQVGVKGFDDYLDYLTAHHEEFAHLFNTILINVTSFFRDPPAWEYLTAEILPRIVAEKNPDGQIRVWSAGCSSGEEAYTVAMLLAETLGIRAYRDRVKIYATDVDEEALAKARLATADTKSLDDVPEPLREKYFEAVGNRYVFRNELRRTVIFGRHDLLQDAPISRVDLLICRNTIMYFEAQTQGHILARLHYALRDKGFLFLGKAEMLLSRESIFQPVELKQRVFVKVPTVNWRERMAVLAQGNLEINNDLDRQIPLREAAGNVMPLAQVVVDAGGYVSMINERARALFGLSSGDIGRPVQDLELSYRPIDLRTHLDQVQSDHQPAEIRSVERVLGNGDVQYLDIDIAPLLSGDHFIGISMIFSDVTDASKLRHDLESHRQELETTSEELQSTNEELETTNEELQSTVEELETTNEELQSSNEELETMNEELESTNTELQTINTELHTRTSQLDQFNVFMSAILASLRLGVSVVDRELRVQLWNHQAEELWGLRADEVLQKPMLQLDIGLPVQQLVEPIAASLSGKNSGYQEVIVDATNRRGRGITVRVVCTPLLRDGAAAPQGVVILMEEMAGATVSR